MDNIDLKRLRKLLKRDTDLLNDSVTVLVVQEDDIDQIHEDFADCAKNKPIPPALLAAFDVSNVLSKLTRQLTKELVIFDGRIDKISKTLGKDPNYIVVGRAHKLEADRRAVGCEAGRDRDRGHPGLRGDQRVGWEGQGRPVGAPAHRGRRHLDGGVDEDVELLGRHHVGHRECELVARGEASEVVDVLLGPIGPVHDRVHQIQAAVVLPGLVDLAQRAHGRVRQLAEEAVDVVLGAIGVHRGLDDVVHQIGDRDLGHLRPGRGDRLDGCAHERVDGRHVGVLVGAERVGDHADAGAAQPVAGELGDVRALTAGDRMGDAVGIGRVIADKDVHDLGGVGDRTRHRTARVLGDHEVRRARARDDARRAAHCHEVAERRRARRTEPPQSVPETDRAQVRRDRGPPCPSSSRPDHDWGRRGCASLPLLDECENQEDAQWGSVVLASTIAPAARRRRATVASTPGR